MLRGVASPARAERVGLACSRHLAGLTTADSDPWILMAARAYCRRLTEHDRTRSASRLSSEAPGGSVSHYAPNGEWEL